MAQRGKIAALLALAAVAGLALASGGGPPIVDVRDKAKNSKYKKSRRIKRDIKRKDITKLTGITLHQVGVRKVGRRAYPKMTAHLGVHHDGTIYYIHPFDTLLFHGHGLNRDTIGIEVAGLFGKNTPIPEAQAAGIRRAIRFAQSEARKLGANITKVYGHRQSSNMRAADPGPAIWSEGAMRSGLETPMDETRGTGKTIPDRWLEAPAVAGTHDADTLFSTDVIVNELDDDEAEDEHETEIA